MDYDVWFIVRDGSVVLHLLISYYGYLTFKTLIDRFGMWSFQCSLSNFTPISLHILKCTWARTISRLFVYCSFADNRDADMCVILSIVCWPFVTSLSRSVCKESPNLAYMCWMLSFVVSLFSFGLILLQPLLPYYCWIHIWFITFMIVNNIYKLVFCFVS